MDINQEIGQRVNHYRKKHGLSQGDLAEAIGLSQGSISQIEKGRRKNLTISNLQSIAIALDVEPGDLYPQLEKTSKHHLVLEDVPQSLHDIFQKLSSQREDKLTAVVEILDGVMELLIPA